VHFPVESLLNGCIADQNEGAALEIKVVDCCVVITLELFCGVSARNKYG
jgi:hypothetical protein